MLDTKDLIQSSTCSSRLSIEYRNGCYEIHEDSIAISKHDDLQEAQRVRCVLERDLSNNVTSTTTKNSSSQFLQY